MLIPSKMNDLITKHFYDKTIELYTFNEVQSLEGGRPRKGSKRVENTINGNIQPVSHKLLKEKYGVDIDARYIITCDVNENVEKKWKVLWNGEEMEVVQVLKYDSHLMILCQ